MANIFDWPNIFTGENKTIFTYFNALFFLTTLFLLQKNMKFLSFLCYMQILQANMPQAGHRGEHFSLQLYSVLILWHISEKSLAFSAVDL